MHRSSLYDFRCEPPCCATAAAAATAATAAVLMNAQPISSPVLVHHHRSDVQPNRGLGLIIDAHTHHRKTG